MGLRTMSVVQLINREAELMERLQGEKQKWDQVFNKTYEAELKEIEEIKERLRVCLSPQSILAGELYPLRDKESSIEKR